MLLTIEQIQAIPGMTNVATAPIAWLNALVGAADGAIKRWLKRDIEQQAYVEYYSGNEHTDIILRQYPVTVARTAIAAGSNGVALPTSTINVGSTANFQATTGTDPTAVSPSLTVQTGPGTFTVVTYTASTATTFTGCSGGTGTLTTGNSVSAGSVYHDPTGYFGQTANGYGITTQLVPGVDYAFVSDSGGKSSNRGLLRRVGGSGAGLASYYYFGGSPYRGKLGASKKPSWHIGDGNIKVCYSAGYAYNKMPAELSFAAQSLVALMLRSQPQGGLLQSETLGAYSYSILAGNPDNPEIGELRRTLAPFREVSW